MEELVRLSLNRPVRLFVDSNTDVADNLQQEFVRIKPKKEGDREAIVAGVCVGGGRYGQGCVTGAQLFTFPRSSLQPHIQGALSCVLPHQEAGPQNEDYLRTTWSQLH